MGRKERDATLLGQGSEWDGKLTFNGSIRIDGYFKGEISSEGILTVGNEGLVEADIHVSYIIIHGEVHGDIIADQRVDIIAPGKVFGNIQAPSVVIDKGVIFEGTTRMYQAKDMSEGKSALVESDKYNGGPPPNLTAIHGIVSELDTGRPVKNAVVRCRGGYSTNTNASGYYELTNLKDGKWKLSIKAKGYKKGKARVEISGGGTYKQDMVLKPKK